MHGFGKSNISLKVCTGELHMICHQSLLTSRNTKQFRKRGLQEIILTPQIISKSYPRPVSYLMSNKAKRNQQKKTHPLIMVFHTPTPKITNSLPPWNTNLTPWFPPLISTPPLFFVSYLYNYFPKRACLN